MPFHNLYEITSSPSSIAIRLSPINPEKPYFSNWRVKDQDILKTVAIREEVVKGTLGLFLGEIEFSYKNAGYISAFKLLIGDQVLLVPKNSVRLLTEEDTKEILPCWEEE